jgi:hypothetical protein
MNMSIGINKRQDFMGMFSIYRIYINLAFASLYFLITSLPIFCSDVLCQEPQNKSSVQLEAMSQLYNQTIFYDGSADAKMKTVVSDLLENLKKVTGQDFKQADSIPAEGIILLRSESKNTPAEFAKRLEGKGEEAFLIHSGDAGKLWIVGNSDDAIRHGIYYYLEQLGCRWFFPNDNWTIIPALKSIALQIDRVETPAFRLRAFFGTGAFGGKLPLDPGMKLQARWGKWMEANRFGGDIQFAGHMGEAFNLKYRKELEAHPEWLAEVNGKRQPWSGDVKWCVSNKDFQQFFVADRLAELKNRPQTKTVSVEPADGTNYCDCEQCRKLGSDADKIFMLANVAAKAVAEKYPGRYVNLYAYGEHAGVPNIPVEPNVYVLAIPYGFQRTGLSGDDLVKSWGQKKGSALGLYDYWAITDWALCLPSMNYLKDIPGKIRFWHKEHIEAFIGESTYSAGSMGIGWYLASKLMWNPEADEKAILDDFYTKSFETAAPPMRRMLERWTNGFILSGHELGLSYQDIVEARRLAKDPSTRARVDDYAKYLHYIRLRHEYQKSSPGSEARKQHARSVLTYIWRIYDSAMVHTYRLHQLIPRREAAEKELTAEFPLNAPKADVWTNLKPLTSAELDVLMADGAQTYKPFNFENKEYSKDLIPLSNPTPLDGKAVESFTFVLDHNFQFWMPKDIPQIEISVMVSKRKEFKEQDGDRVTVTGPKNEILIRQKIPNDGQWHPLTIPNRGEGLYLMNIFDQKIMFNVKIPANLPFVVLDGFMCPTMSTSAYFYVPKGLKRLALYCPSVAPVYFKLYDSTGAITPYHGDNIIVADVPAGQDGKVWSISGYKSWAPLRPLNFPAAFSFTKQGLMVPAELKK